jgi:hypothetical protein
MIDPCGIAFDRPSNAVLTAGNEKVSEGGQTVSRNLGPGAELEYQVILAPRGGSTTICCEQRRLRSNWPAFPSASPARSLDRFRAPGSGRIC